MSMSTPRRIALITGAGSGIGKAASIGLALDGFRVVLAGRRLEPLTEVARQITASGGSALAFTADVSDPASCQALFAQLARECGRLDVLFNNAGVASRPAPIEDLTLAEWKTVIDVNLTGAFLCAQAAVRLMRAQTPQGGRIINNGSLSAHVPRPHSAPYTASKHAISGLTKTVALEGRRYHIACGQIDIGNARTNIGSHVASGALQADGAVTEEPMLDLVHVANAVRYMASLPLDANVLSLNVMATTMPYVGRG
jgi:NAD(P)-dependent dehydrogenase (short-subunit alcohol dehydrogenase family)